MKDEPHSSSKKYNTFAKHQKKHILEDLQQGLAQLGMKTSCNPSFCGDELLKFIAEIKKAEYDQLLHKMLAKHVENLPQILHRSNPYRFCHLSTNLQIFQYGKGRLKDG